MHACKWCKKVNILGKHLIVSFSFFLSPLLTLSVSQETSSWRKSVPSLHVWRCFHQPPISSDSFLWGAFSYFFHLIHTRTFSHMSLHSCTRNIQLLLVLPLFLSHRSPKTWRVLSLAVSQLVSVHRVMLPVPTLLRATLKFAICSLGCKIKVCLHSCESVPGVVERTSAHL